MRLFQALQLSDGEVVAFVGAGGKTTGMFRLAEDVVEQGGRVLTTTTTHMSTDQIRIAPRHLSAFEANRVAVAAALARNAHVLITGPADRTLGRASAVTTGLLEELQQLPDLNAIVVEADGARMLPFKAPAAHEPVIPSNTSLVVPVAGLDALGRPLAEDQVHRPEIIARLAGVELGTPVNPTVVAAVLAHPDGGLKGVPAGARVRVLLNKAETPEALAAGREIAARVLAAAERVDAVLLGTVRRPNAVREVHGRVAAVVLAAGRSTRMGRSKQLLPWGGSTMLAEVVRRLRQTTVTDIVVVTGAEGAAVEASLADLQPGEPRLRCVFNPDFAVSEMARSLQVGLRTLPANRSAALVILADQPHLETGVVEAVAQRWRETQAPVVAPYFQGQRGHPMLFDRTVWPAILALAADANPREAVRAAGAIERVDVDSETILRDIDTPDEYARQAAADGLL